MPNAVVPEFICQLPLVPLWIPPPPSPRHVIRFRMLLLSRLNIGDPAAGDRTLHDVHYALCSLHTPPCPPPPSCNLPCNPPPPGNHHFHVLVPPKKSMAAPKARAKAAPSQEQSQPPNGLLLLRKRALKWLPKQPRAPLPPPHRRVQHTPCLSCKVNMCNTSKCVILVPRSSLPFLWIPNNICFA